MTYFTADPNVWYAITTVITGSTLFLAPNAYVGGDHAQVGTTGFATPVDLTGWVGVQWQFFPVVEPANVSITFPDLTGDLLIKYQGTYFLRNRMFEDGWFNSYSPNQDNLTLVL